MRRKTNYVLVAAPLCVGLLAALAVVGAVGLENNDAFCASCHTEPEANFYRRTLTEPSDLASAHSNTGIRCIDCHSGEGVAGRLGALQQGASDLVAYLGGGYEQPAVTHHPVGEIGCVKCHTPPSRDNSVIGDLNHIHSQSHYHLVEYAAAWQAASPNPAGTCVACHVAHSEGTIESLLWRPMRIVSAMCDTCHIALSGQMP